jgi:hypothetical protein
MTDFDNDKNNSDEIGFMLLTEGQPKDQREAGEELYALLSLAYIVKYENRHDLKNAKMDILKDLPQKIRFFAGVLNDSPVECPTISGICGVSRKIARTMTRLDNAWEDEFRTNFAPKVKTAILDTLEMIEAFDEAARD